MFDAQTPFAYSFRPAPFARSVTADGRAVIRRAVVFFAVNVT
jgi:hypothetical protein